MAARDLSRACGRVRVSRIINESRLLSTTSNIQESIEDMLEEQGIVQKKSGLGFCEGEQKWYGWSHRAMCGFGIGDMIFESEFGDENTLFTKHGSVKIETLDQAKQSAENFSDYVS